MADQIFELSGDGRRADVTISEKTGLSRSRVAGLMAAGACLVNGEGCAKAGMKVPDGRNIRFTVPEPRPAAPQAGRPSSTRPTPTRWSWPCG